MRKPIPSAAPDLTGFTVTSGWVEHRPRLRVGARVEIDGEWWTVTAMGQPCDSSRVHRGWHVGGL